MGEGFVPLKFSQSTLQFEPLKVVVFDVLCRSSGTTETHKVEGQTPANAESSNWWQVKDTNQDNSPSTFK